jgi:hypothetical protein
MRARFLAVVAALLAAAPAAPSRAAGCPLITDARGDSTPLVYGHQTPADDALGARGTDLLAANAWTDDTYVNAVIRVAELPPAPTAPRAHGYEWEMQLRAEGGIIRLVASESNGTWSYDSTWETASATSSGAATTTDLASTGGTLDPKRGEIHLEMPLAVVAPYTKVGAGVRWMPSVWSFVLDGPPSVDHLPPLGVGIGADNAPGKRPVVVGRPECAS